MPRWESQEGRGRLTLPWGRDRDWERAWLVDDRRLLSGHLPQREDPAPLPPGRPPRTGRRRPVTGYRRYTSDQIPIAQVIRRFRDLDMPLDDIGSVLQAPDQTVRCQLIAAHLARLEESPGRDPARRGLLARPARTPVAAGGDRAPPGAGHAGGGHHRHGGRRRSGGLVPRGNRRDRRDSLGAGRSPPVDRPAGSTPTSCSPRSGARPRCSCRERRGPAGRPGAAGSRAPRRSWR